MKLEGQACSLNGLDARAKLMRNCLLRGTVSSMCWGDGISIVGGGDHSECGEKLQCI